MKRVQQANPVGSSTILPDGRLFISTTQGLEQFVVAMEAWFGHGKPTFEIMSLHKLGPAELARFQQVENFMRIHRGLPVIDLSDASVWCVEYKPKPGHSRYQETNDLEEQIVGRYIVCEHLTRDEAMFLLWCEEHRLDEQFHCST